MFNNAAREGCALRYGDVVADDLGLHVHPPGTFLVVTGLFVVLGLALLSTMIVVKSCCPGILISSIVRAKRPNAGRGGSVVRGVDKVTSGNKNKGVGATRSVAKREIQTNREQCVYRDEEERFSLRKIRWPKFVSNAVTNHFPGSGTVPDTSDTPVTAAAAAAVEAEAAAEAEAEVVASASSSSFSFESCSPPSSIVSPYGGESPVPLIPSVAATRITAEALKRFEKSAPPLSFNRGVGTWTSSERGLPTDMTGSAEEPIQSVPPLKSTAISSSNASRTRSRSSAKPIAMDRVTGSPQMVKARGFVPPYEREPTNSSGAQDRGVMSGDRGDADQESRSAPSGPSELSPTLAAVGTVAATARMMVMSTATSLFSDRSVVRGENPPASRSTCGQPREVHFSLQQSSQVGVPGEGQRWAPVRGRPPTPKRRHGKQRSRPLLPPPELFVSMPERGEMAARKHPGSEQILRTPKFARGGDEGHQTTVDESPPATVSPLRPHDDDSFKGDARGLIASASMRSTSVSVAGVGTMEENHNAGYFGSFLAGVSPPSE